MACHALSTIGPKMKFNPNAHHRHSLRLSGYDYTQPGAYFITICTHGRECLFGEVVEGKMILNEYGIMATACWQDIHKHFPGILSDMFTMMPNQLHGIVIIKATGRGMACQAPLEPIKHQFSQPIPNSIPAIIGAFKSAITKRINATRQMPGMPVWQRNYYEHVIRDEVDLNNIRQYIECNPIKWAEDEENPMCGEGLIPPMTR
jgi:putative transposase